MNGGMRRKVQREEGRVRVRPDMHYTDTKIKPALLLSLSHTLTVSLSPSLCVLCTSNVFATEATIQTMNQIFLREQQTNKRATRTTPTRQNGQDGNRAIHQQTHRFGLVVLTLNATESLLLFVRCSTHCHGETEIDYPASVSAGFPSCGEYNTESGGVGGRSGGVRLRISSRVTGRVKRQTE